MRDAGFYLGLDTSNYTTSAAVCDAAGGVIANLKIPLPVADGNRGLRQSDAVFAHVRHMPRMAEQVRAVLAGREISAVGCSVSPRDCAGSYMPCFLVGEGNAATIAAALDVPLYRFSHQSGHVSAALYSAGADALWNGEFCAFHVSGGTTEILHVTPEPNGRMTVVPIGGTDDLHAGQLIDRIGVAMGMQFPCGQEMERLAEECTVPPERMKLCVRGLHCNLSGAENQALALYDATKDKKQTSAFVLDFLGRTLEQLTDHLRVEYPGLPVVYSGGVMSNRRLRRMLDTREDVYFAEPAFSADNAAGIALLTRRAHMAQG